MHVLIAAKICALCHFDRSGGISYSLECNGERCLDFARQDKDGLRFRRSLLLKIRRRGTAKEATAGTVASLLNCSFARLRTSSSTACTRTVPGYHRCCPECRRHFQTRTQTPWAGPHRIYRSHPR